MRRFSSYGPLNTKSHYYASREKLIQQAYTQLTGDKIEFKFDDESTNYLYMNGVIDEEKVGTKEYYVKFSCPFVQNRLFNYFSNRIFSHMGPLIHPLDAMADAITEHTLDIPNIIKRYKAYLKKNREVFFKDVPRRKTDMRRGKRTGTGNRSGRCPGYCNSYRYFALR